VIHVDEIPAALDQLLAGRGAKNHDLVYATLDPALTRFEALGKDDQQAFRDLVAKFISVYGFIAQIVDYTDKEREGHYVYARALESRLPRDTSGSIDIGSDVVLTHLRTEMTAKGRGELPGGAGDVKVGFSGGKEHEVNKENLSKIIDELNERFGLDLDESDQLLFDQFEQEWEKDPEIVAIAKANDFENFRLVFERMFLATILKRVDDNEEIFKRILDDKAFQALIKEWYAKRVFDALNKKPKS
jgi:type I restriction enzyme R subunit